jgi:uncharacterized protein
MLTAKNKQETTLTAWKPVVLFLLIAYGTAWALWLPLVLGPRRSGSHPRRRVPSILGSLGTVDPLIASFLVVRYETGIWAMPSNLLPTKGLLTWLNLLTGPAIAIIAFVVIPYVICVVPGHKLISLSFLTPLLAIWPDILGGPLEEEFGWRGYLLPRIAARSGNLWATLVVGVIWASWHLPLIVCRVWVGLSFWYYLPLVMALAVFASLAYFATGRSILGPIILHYVFNTCSPMLGRAFKGQPLYSNRDANEIILICMVGVALLTTAATRGRMGERQKSIN